MATQYWCSNSSDYLCCGICWAKERWNIAEDMGFYRLYSLEHRFFFTPFLDGLCTLPDALHQHFKAEGRILW